MNVDMKISAPKFILDPVTQNFGKDFLKHVLEVTRVVVGEASQREGRVHGLHQSDNRKILSLMNG